MSNDLLTPEPNHYQHDRYVFALTSAGLGTWDLDPLNHIVAWDDLCKQFYGFSKDDVVGYDEVLRCIHAEDRERVDQAVTWALNPASGGLYEISFRTIGAEDGLLRWLHCKGKAYFNENGEAYRFSGTAQDVSSHREAQQKVQAAENLAQLALESSKAGSFYILLATDAISYTPRLAEILTGEPRSQLNRQNFIASLHPQDEHIRDEAYQIANQTGHLQYEARFVWRDGSVHWARVIGTFAFDTDGTPLSLAGIVQEITDEVIHQQEDERLKALVNGSEECMGIADMNGNLLFVNPYGLQLTGLTLAQVKRMNLLEFCSADAYRLLTQEILPTLKQEGRWAGNVPFRSFPSGKAIPVHMKASYLKDKSGHVLNLLFTAHDLRAELASRQSLQESEALFRNITTASTAALWITDAQLHITYVSQRWIDWTGEPLNQHVGFGWLDFVVEQDRAQTAERFLADFHAKRNHKNQFRIFHTDGTIRWVDCSGSPQFNEQGNFTGYIGAILDVTSTVEAQHQLLNSQDRLQSIILQAPVAISLLMGRSMVIETANDRILELWGKTEAVIGLPLTQALPELEGQPFMQLLEGVYDTGQAHYGISTLARLERGGVLQDCYFDFVYAPLREAEGHISGVMVIATEVTEQVRIRLALEASERRFRKLIEEAPMATGLYKGRELQVELVNEAMIKLWGKDKSVLNKKLPEALPELEGQPFLQILDDVFTSGKAYHAQADPVDLVIDGRMQRGYYNFTYKPLRNEFGEVYAILNMAVDVTQQMTSQKALEKSQKQYQLLASQLEERVAERTLELDQLNQELTLTNNNLQQFAYAASHDLQEPLRKIQTFSSILAERHTAGLTESGLNLLHRIQSTADRMSMLVKDVLDYSRLTTTQGLEQKAVELRELLDGVLLDLEMPLQEEKVELVISPLPTVWGNARQLTQLLQNLLSNAIKFHKPGEHPRVEIRTQKATAEEMAMLPQLSPFRTYIRLDVSDNGIGFEEEYKEQIFQIFQRLNSRDNYLGTGIGLALCRKVAENHQGYITAQSQPGQGATFQVFLPDSPPV
ncbi:hypothetical protein BWI97_23025 [Siphonobacter sp. BAB-5405]|uniref:PAS domain S-box protein n=1 Tax=Siphonobacter sp. BAB-5405 TaxID=1864825 RepID=UPI000C800050|nr:PAS domain S-box protein [Siphonobacter sp. BAB-5405]PMD90364.1 hypothetical protein BWI97_23025 [Siphonobacter sp. BAB-5405]